MTGTIGVTGGAAAAASPGRLARRPRRPGAGHRRRGRPERPGPGRPRPGRPGPSRGRGPRHRPGHDREGDDRRAGLRPEGLDVRRHGPRVRSSGSRSATPSASTSRTRPRTRWPHSIDFHASQVAWNDEMRSIAPGEELVYEWTADYAGVWMYHCGTSPALHHIANGMFGMVIVEPREGLPPVDQEFAIVQSEWYLGPQGEVVDLTKAMAAAPGARLRRVQRRRQPVPGRPARVATGEPDPHLRARRRPEHRQLVPRRGHDLRHGHQGRRAPLAKGNAGNWGSQAVDLSPAQGAIVEFTTAEDGLYPMVTHAFNFVGRGALGIVQVRRRRPGELTMPVDDRRTPDRAAGRGSVRGLLRRLRRRTRRGRRSRHDARPDRRRRWRWPRPRPRPRRRPAHRRPEHRHRRAVRARGLAGRGRSARSPARAWLPLHLVLAGAAGTAIAGVLPFFTAALAVAPPADPRARLAAVGLIVVGADPRRRGDGRRRDRPRRASAAPCTSSDSSPSGWSRSGRCAARSARAGGRSSRAYLGALAAVVVGVTPGDRDAGGLGSRRRALGDAQAGPRLAEPRRLAVAHRRGDADPPGPDHRGHADPPARRRPGRAGRSRPRRRRRRRRLRPGPRPARAGRRGDRARRRRRRPAPRARGPVHATTHGRPTRAGIGSRPGACALASGWFLAGHGRDGRPGPLARRGPAGLVARAGRHPVRDRLGPAGPRRLVEPPHPGARPGRSGRLGPSRRDRLGRGAVVRFAGLNVGVLLAWIGRRRRRSGRSRCVGASGLGLALAGGGRARGDRGPRSSSGGRALTETQYRQTPPDRLSSAAWSTSSPCSPPSSAASTA